MQSVACEIDEINYGNEEKQLAFNLNERRNIGSDGGNSASYQFTRPSYPMNVGRF